MKDLLSRGDGKIIEENVDEMNDEFSKEYREEQERLKNQKKIEAFEDKIRKLESDIKNKENNLQKLREEYGKELGSK